MSTTPKTTPVVPGPRQATTTAEPRRKPPLKAPIVVVTATGEWSHAAGALTIGRDADAEITIEDPLVSRKHARLQVQSNGEVLLEDMHSSNGVFVNGSKISRPSVHLCEGDRLLFGTTEVSVFSLRPSATVPVSRRLDNTSADVGQAAGLGNASAATPLGSIVGRARPGAITGRQYAIDIVGSLADQLVANGHALEAERVLSEHLQSLLKGASVGLTVPDRILECAAGYALRLHAWTQHSTWVDYVFELHIACRQIPSETSLQALEAVCKSVPVNRDLIRYLIKSLEAMADNAAIKDQQRLQRLRQLAR